MTNNNRGPELPTIFPTVVHMLADACARSPQQDALICGTETLTYSEYNRCVAAFAHRLIQAGARGERVAILLANSNDAAIAIFAAHAAGAQAVPLNPAYTASELGPILADAACKVIVCDFNVEPVVHAAGVDRTALRIVVGSDAERLTRWRSEPKWELPHPAPNPDDLATLQYTGGTTGKAKGVNLTHRAIATNVSQRERVLPTRVEHERILAITPLFHVYAMAMCLHLAVYARSTLIWRLPRWRKSASRCWPGVRRFFKALWPTMLSAGRTSHPSRSAHREHRRCPRKR